VIIGSSLEVELSPSPREGLYGNGPGATENEARSEVAVALRLCLRMEGWAKETKDMQKLRSGNPRHKVCRQRAWVQRLGKASEPELLSEPSDLSPNSHIATTNLTSRSRLLFELTAHIGASDGVKKRRAVAAARRIT
jgi:hypothetical protein